jgi:hypothetical protein
MERTKFYKIIDGLTEGWYIDAHEPVKGTWASKIHDKGVVRRKTNQRGEENEVNTTNGCVQILAWAKPSQMCVQCCKFVEDKREIINLKKSQISCSCGLKYPIINLETVK